MSLTTLFLELVLVGAGAYGLRRRRHWLFVLVLAAGVAGSLVSTAQYLVTGGVWWLAPWDFLLAPATVAVAIVAFTNFVPVVAQDRPPGPSVGDFDRELYATLQELGDILNNGPEQDRASIDSWVSEAAKRSDSVLRHLERMNAPNGDWQELLGAYIELTRKTIAAIPSGVPPDDRILLVAEGDGLSRKYEDLRRRYGRGWRART